MPQSRYRADEIIRQRRLEYFPFAGPRMPKAKLPGMQHLPRKFLREFWRINSIAHYGVTEVMKVDPNLMGPAAVQSALDQTHFARRTNNTILGHGRAPSRQSHPHSLSIHGVSRDFLIDYARVSA